MIKPLQESILGVAVQSVRHKKRQQHCYQLFFKKPLDILLIICYNIRVVRNCYESNERRKQNAGYNKSPNQNLQIHCC